MSNTKSKYETCPDCRDGVLSAIEEFSLGLFSEGRGSGWQTCWKCDGDGKLQDDTLCHDCNGKGKVPCETCDGNGMIEVEDDDE